MCFHCRAFTWIQSYTHHPSKTCSLSLTTRPAVLTRTKPWHRGPMSAATDMAVKPPMEFCICIGKEGASRGCYKVVTLPWVGLTWGVRWIERDREG